MGLVHTVSQSHCITLTLRLGLTHNGPGTYCVPQPHCAAVSLDHTTMGTKHNGPETDCVPVGVCSPNPKL